MNDWDIHALKEDLDQLNEHTALGRYTERLLSIWFKHNPHFELLKFNLQIVVQKRTVGEIDFLLLEKDSGKAVQLEFAIKYFLAKQSDQEDTQFIGPKGRDSLKAKSKKLIEQQMQLSLNHSEQLEEGLRAFDFKPQIMLKGELFFPLGKSDKSNLWMYYKEIDRLMEWNQADEFVILKKRRDWLFPFDLALWHKPLSPMDCLKQLRSLNDQIPMMIVYKRESGDYGRLMIVDNNWPQPI